MKYFVFLLFISFNFAQANQPAKELVDYTELSVKGTTEVARFFNWHKAINGPDEFNSWEAARNACLSTRDDVQKLLELKGAWILKLNDQCSHQKAGVTNGAVHFRFHFLK